MRSLPALAAAAGAICKRDFLIFASYRTRMFTTFFTTAVSLTLFYYVSRLVSSPRVGSPDEYYAFVVVGLMIFAVLTSTLSAPVSTLRAELQAGTFERMVLSPFGPVRSIASLLLFPLLLSLAVAIVSLAYAGAVFGLELRWSTVPAAIPLAVLAAAAFAPFGLLMTAAVVVFKQTNAGATLLITGITLLAGVYFPVELLPGWIQWASEVQPFTPAVDLLRNVLVGTDLHDPVWAELLKLGGFAAAMLPLSFFVLRAAVALSRRKGTIIEY
ncbi:MAG: ABC transporter permease [Actinomycetota bacterium]|nr:ABC transporter permease [Actinomycetota bacterium]